MQKQTKVISVQLDMETYVELKRICDEKEQPVQGLIRYLLKKHLASLKER